MALDAKKKYYSTSLTSKITKLRKEKLDIITEVFMQNPCIYKKNSVVLPNLQSMPLKKLDHFKLTSIKETILDPLEKKSKLRSAQQIRSLESDKKKFKDTNAELFDSERKFKELLEKKLKKSTESAKLAEQAFEQKKNAIEQKKQKIVQEYYDCFLSESDSEVSFSSKSAFSDNSK